MFVFMVVFRRLSWRHRQGLSGLFDQLHWLFIHADHGVIRVILPLVNLQDVFHSGDELTVLYRRNQPTLAEVRSQLVFFSVRRTVWSEIESTTSKETNSSANILSGPLVVYCNLWQSAELPLDHPVFILSVDCLVFYVPKPPQTRAQQIVAEYFAPCLDGSQKHRLLFHPTILVRPYLPSAKYSHA